MRMVAVLLLLLPTACGGPRQPPSGPAPVPLASVEQGAIGQPALPTGYAAHPEATQLSDPRAVLFDTAAGGRPLVLEGEPARLARVEEDGSLTPIAQGGGNGPWTGAARLDGAIYVAEAGGPLGGRILRVGGDGGVTPVKAALPSGGVLGPVIGGRDGWLYVAVAAAATGERGARDIPCQDVRIRGGGQIEGAVPCTGSVLRLRPDSGEVEVYAWGFHDPAGLAFAADGRLLVAEHLPPPEQQAAAGDMLVAAVPGVWYGWPDYAGQLALADPQLADVPNPPPPPMARLPGDASSVAAANQPAFGGGNQAFVALNSPAHAGLVAFTSLDSGATAAFATNMSRPTALAFSPDGESLLVADAGTGTLWRIVPFDTP